MVKVIIAVLAVLLVWCIPALIGFFILEKAGKLHKLRYPNWQGFMLSAGHPVIHFPEKLALHLITGPALLLMALRFRRGVLSEQQGNHIKWVTMKLK